jgi:uncharacterized protein (TIGR00251 family)
VVPRASRTEVVGPEAGVLRVRVHAPPVEGAANEAVVRCLADVLSVPRSSVVVVRGTTAREKVIKVAGIAPAEVRRRLGF